MKGKFNEYTTYELEDLDGKVLEMFIGVDEGINPSITTKVLYGKDSTGKIYVLREEVITE